MSGHCRGAFKLIDSEQSMTPDAMLVISLENFFNTVTTNVLQNLPDLHVIFVESLNGAIKRASLDGQGGNILTLVGYIGPNRSAHMNNRFLPPTVLSRIGIEKTDMSMWQDLARRYEINVIYVGITKCSRN